MPAETRGPIAGHPSGGRPTNGRARRRTPSVSSALLFGLCCLASSALADDAGWSVESVAFRVGSLEQRGRGGQSQAAPARDGDGILRGSEEVSIYQLAGRVTVRQNDNLVHVLDVPVDVVTHASADALDAVSSASLQTTSGDFTLNTTWDVSDDDIVSFRGGYHIEEEWQSGYGGVGYTRELADDNATLSLQTNLIVDFFSDIDERGNQNGTANRTSASIDAQFSQVLSETTVAWLGYGLTIQEGTLARTWNAVPVAGGGAVIAERLPDKRSRHALYARIAQHLPWTGSTLRAGYRYYLDDFDATAHSADFMLHQSVLPWLDLRASYRLHSQTAVSFFVDEAPASARGADTPVTSDSDLGAFDATELGAALWLHLGGAPNESGSHHIGASYHRYSRARLDIDLFGLGYSHNF